MYTNLENIAGYASIHALKVESKHIEAILNASKPLCVHSQNVTTARAILSGIEERVISLCHSCKVPDKVIAALLVMHPFVLQKDTDNPSFKHRQL